ncbi:unnamed protein product [Pseudo-nitzschia multistriata]|uniref:Transmembrane protein n=1 Tax=Pseudo-nitzschia multistriata TaxID=183589 RepID=A0A448YZI3_9STRA|nr:unnamed protein product [Pseudo-nitzschia multistriata]
MLITFGLLLLTAVYIGMVLALHYKSPVECLETNTNTGVDSYFDGISAVVESDSGAPCQTEGVDNTILNWASDFFLAFWTFVFALHLSFLDPSKREVRKSGILAQVFMGGAFLMAGLGNWLFPNSGTEDNRGLLGYWVSWIFSRVFFAISGLATAHFALCASLNTDPNLKNRSLLSRSYVPLAVCETLFVLSLSGFLTGSIWCSIEPELRADGVIDAFGEAGVVVATGGEEFEKHVCFRIASASEAAMNASYALLWLPAGFLLRAASRNKPAVVMGLPTPIAAVLAMVLQWTVGSMLVVAFAVVDALVANKAGYFEAWNTVYGTVLYHWGMLMTLACVHNLSYGLPLFDANEDEGPAPLSWEWWVAMVAGMVPEPTEPPAKKPPTGAKPSGDEREGSSDEESAYHHDACEASDSKRKTVSFDVVSTEISM